MDVFVFLYWYKLCKNFKLLFTTTVLDLVHFFIATDLYINMELNVKTECTDVSGSNTLGGIFSINYVIIVGI